MIDLMILNISLIAKGGFGKVYKANWLDGYIQYWDSKNQNWKRKGDNMFVALKSLNTNSQNISLEFMNEVKLFYYWILWNNSRSRNKKLYNGFGLCKEWKFTKLFRYKLY